MKSFLHSSGGVSSKRGGGRYGQCQVSLGYCADVPQPLQSCSVVANGAVLKESFSVEVQS